MSAVVSPHRCDARNSQASRGWGADLGGLEGAGAHCLALVAPRGQPAPAATTSAAVSGGADANNLDVLTGSDRANTPCGNGKKSATGLASAGHADHAGLRTRTHDVVECAANGLSRSDGCASHGSMTLPARRVAANLNAPTRWPYSDALIRLAPSLRRPVRVTTDAACGRVRGRR